VNLTSETLRDMLVAIFGVDEKYVVPKQGNWWNPQDMLSTPDKPKTWVAYSIEDDRPVDVVHYQPSDNGTSPDSVQHRIANCVLQCVGERAHDLALSVGHWIHNPVAQAQFYMVEGRLMGDVGRVTCTDFFQDGLNTVKAYNVAFRIAWTSRIASNQGLMENIVFEGEVT
jgi:hypothetical protein